MHLYFDDIRLCRLLLLLFWRFFLFAEKYLQLVGSAIVWIASRLPDVMDRLNRPGALRTREVELAPVWIERRASLFDQARSGGARSAATGRRPDGRRRRRRRRGGGFLLEEARARRHDVAAAARLQFQRRRSSLVRSPTVDVQTTRLGVNAQL